MMHELLKTRYSPRVFSDRTVEHGKIVSLLEAAQWSPSSMNGQPWRFIVASKEDDANFKNLLGLLYDANKAWAKNAAVLILTIAKLDNDSNGQLNKHAFYDLGNSVANLTFQAMYMNLFIRQMGGFNVEDARNVFSIPKGYEPVSVLAVGYKGNADVLPENLKIREQAVRTRKDLNEIAFEEKFGKPYLNNKGIELSLRKAG